MSRNLIRTVAAAGVAVGALAINPAGAGAAFGGDGAPDTPPSEPIEVGGRDEVDGSGGGDGTPMAGSNAEFCTVNGFTGRATHLDLDEDQASIWLDKDKYFAPAEGPGIWQMRFCGGVPDQVVFVPLSGANLAAFRDIAEEMAELALPEPDISVNPSEDRPQLVNLETWLWAEGGTWQAMQESRSATVGAASVSVTIDATPRSITWDMGDGTAPFTCTGDDMVPYDATRPMAAQATGCSHTYLASSARQPGATYAVTATATWIVDAAVNGVPVFDDEPFTQTSTTPLAVAERQTLNR